MENPQTRADPIGPIRITINPELLIAATRGDKSLVENLLARTEIAISASPDDALSAQDTGAISLLGVTIGGNTALHIAATHGHLELAQLIFKKEMSLLVACNVMLETPLHCAVRAGHGKIVSFFVASFTSEGEDAGVGDRTAIRARNRHEETALHLAVQNGHVDVAKELMSADPKLVSMVDEQGTSPLYLAVMAGSVALLRAILGSSSSTTPTTVSYAGPDGRTAMHAAALFGNLEIADKLLKWKQILAKIADKLGSTPLHYAASTGNDKMVKLLLDHDTCLAYISDLDGLFPVHIAARWGVVAVINVFIEKCPNLDELLNNEGRNLLHIAVEHEKIELVKNVCRKSELVKLMNGEDYEWNTPLHLAVRKGDEKTVSLLVGNKRVCLNIMNKDGLTPLDLSTKNIETSFKYWQDPRSWICLCLLICTGTSTLCALNFIPNKTEKDKSKEESDKHINVSQSLAITAILIATVTFASAFALPGGYRDDGTPTLKRRYAFRAFVIADTLAFILSIIATCWITLGGTLVVQPSIRVHNILSSTRLVTFAAKCVVAAFALGLYLVLAPVSNSTGIVVCVAASTYFLFDNPSNPHLYRLGMTIKNRRGWTGLCKFVRSNAIIIIRNVLYEAFACIVIFLLALVK
ncbi:protein ACCELERATED CELL DEATH 6-like [Typha angustifolia]|uniref:protein ACCELERATED CELL DEATH 6-like n=1 Tax=Typha angustifolia TaxID=59011 RepID=UPI003C2DC81D